MLEQIRLLSLHQLNVVLSQLKWRPLEIDIPRAARYQKTEIYVDDVTLGVDEDVLVMTVFDLEEVLDYRITC
jgi:hypothetical protein